MQHPTITLIVRYPNQTLQLATQEHLKRKLIAECDNCHGKEVIDSKERSFKCKKCSKETKIKAPDGLNCRQEGCNGSMKIFQMTMGLMAYQCDNCNHTEPVKNYG